MAIVDDAHRPIKTEAPPSSRTVAHRRQTHQGSLLDRFVLVRELTERLAQPLSAEDQTVQSMPDVSPTKWHRAHTSWFFETFLLAGTDSYEAFDPSYRYLFNSYYEGVGPRHTRSERGFISRPGCQDIACYRAHVDQAMTRFMRGQMDEATSGLVELGLHHEQQHQELLLMDIKHVLSVNPIRPAYGALDSDSNERSSGSTPPGWVVHEGGMVEVGHSGPAFGFDNESPRHQAFLHPFSVADRLVTCGEWLDFIDDGGYSRPDLWLSDGWAAVQALGWDSPLYWQRLDGRWRVFTLGGERDVSTSEPVCHVSYYEADAFARWAGARLPTEFEWEAVAALHDGDAHYLDTGYLHPRPQDAPAFMGDAWVWTSSAYLGYPGFKPASGAVGEYNGKFMVNQQVLRGGSCATPSDHMRMTYRNFFPPSARWAFSGLRLARDVETT